LGKEKTLALAEKLGKFEAQLVTGALKEVVIEYSGEILNYNVAPITISLLKGLLTPILNESVNYINAPLIAKERGIKVVEAKSRRRRTTQAISSRRGRQGRGVSRAPSSSGTADRPINKLHRGGTEGRMFVLFNEDKPGVIGSVARPHATASTSRGSIWAARAGGWQAMVVWAPAASSADATKTPAAA
jgi:D-3-phosphoglycerate dehydrogenase